MGFLLGAFGKLAAGRRVRQLQAKMMRVQSRLRRATRQVADMEKMLQRQEKMELNSLTMMSNSGMMGAKSTIWNSIFGSGGVGAAIYEKMQGGGQLNTEENNQYANYMSQYNMQINNMSAMNEMNVSMMKQQIEDKYEYLRESMLQPLKDEEEMLQTEQDSLQSQIQIAQEDYKACKQMEQQDAKNLAPSYTGAAG